MLTSEQMLLTLRGAFLVLSGLLMGALAFALAEVVALPQPRLGSRGRARAAAKQSLWVALLEPCVRVLGGYLRFLNAPGVRGYLQRLLSSSGAPLGLDVDELLGCCLLSGLALGLPTALLVSSDLLDFLSVGVCIVAVAVCVPAVRLKSLGLQRAKALERSLPAVMDLCVLCMGAGADFPQALRLCVQELGRVHRACREELTRTLDELALGRTRAEAFAAFGARVDSDAVQDLVASIVQSDEKGTPLIDALTIQAKTLRQRRSVLAEERAAKAALALLLPLLLMVVGMFLVILGPMMVSGTGL